MRSLTLLADTVALDGGRHPLVVVIVGLPRPASIHPRSKKKRKHEEGNNVSFRLHQALRSGED
jgi:hypothetical protein